MPAFRWILKSAIEFVKLVRSGFISIIFTQLTKLGGLTNDEVLNLVGINGVIIDFRGLLLAGIIIGTLGVIDDVIISSKNPAQNSMPPHRNMMWINK